jgi:hypothetical protein
MNPSQLEERLIQFAVDVILMSKENVKSFASQH